MTTQMLQTAQSVIMSAPDGMGSVLIAGIAALLSARTRDCQRYFLIRMILRESKCGTRIRIIDHTRSGAGNVDVDVVEIVSPERSHHR